MNFIDKNVFFIFVIILAFFITNKINAQVLNELGGGPIEELVSCENADPNKFSKCEDGRCVPNGCASLGCSTGTPNGCGNEAEAAITLCDGSTLTCCGDCEDIPF